MPHQDFLLLVLADEAARRDSLATSLRAQRARLDPAMQLELWDSTARVTYDQTLWNELVSLPRARARPYRLPSRPLRPRLTRRQDAQDSQALAPG
jgi:hypothetical protein